MPTNETIKIQVGEEVIELTSADKKTYLEQLAKDKVEQETQNANKEAEKALKVSAYTKLGLTQEEIDAIL
jgi:hypothetical protein